MSAIYSLVLPGSVQVLTDGAIYTKDHVLTGAADKAFASRSIPLVCSGRGNHGVVTTLCGMVLTASALGSFDRTIELVQGVIDRGRNRLAEMEPFDLLIAGWSETAGPCHFFVASHDRHGMEPFVLCEPQDEVGLGPVISRMELVAAGLTPAKLQQAGEDALRLYGADLMELMRRTPATNPVDPDSLYHHGIGCHCDLSIVTAHGVEQIRLREWPDVVGELIDPFATDRVAA